MEPIYSISDYTIEHSNVIQSMLEDGYELSDMTSETFDKHRILAVEKEVETRADFNAYVDGYDYFGMERMHPSAVEYLFCFVWTR